MPLFSQDTLYCPRIGYIYDPNQPPPGNCAGSFQLCFYATFDNPDSAHVRPNCAGVSYVRIDSTRLKVHAIYKRAEIAILADILVADSVFCFSINQNLGIPQDSADLYYENIIECYFYIIDSNGEGFWLRSSSGGFAYVPDCEIRYTSFKSDFRRLCAGSCVNFRDSSDRYPSHHRWYFEGGSPSYSELRDPQGICYSQTGKYKVKHVVSNSVSSDSLSVENYIEVLPRPELSSSDTLTELEGFWGDTLKLTPCSNADYYLWSPNKNISCTDCANPSIVLREQTEYVLQAWNDKDCVTTCKQKLKINKRQSKIYIPNIFSPNNDGINDEFEVYGIFYELKSMEIFDRWGNLLFRSDSPTAKWDGRFQDKELGAGVYVYNIIYLDTSTQRSQNESGTVTLLR